RLFTNSWKNWVFLRNAQIQTSTNIKTILHMQTSKTLFRIVSLALAATFIIACSKEAKKTRFLAEADSYFKASNYDKAKVSYLNVVRLDPQNALAFERIGAMWLEDGSPLRAAAFLAKANEVAPKNDQNRIRLARCYLAIGRFADASKQALKVLEQTPDNGDAIIALTEAARSKEDIQAAEQHLEKYPKKDDISFHLASANLCLSSGDLAAAEKALRPALTVNPNSSAAHMALGDLYLLKKDQKQAGEEFKKAAELAPVRSMERLKYAAFMSAAGDTAETRRISTEMTTQAPDYLPGWTLLAELAFKEGKYDEALSLLENVFSREPQYIDGHRLESEVLLAKGDTKKATEVLERLDQTYPDTPLIKYELARAYLKKNNMNQAKVVLDQAISINPNYAEAILLLADINLRSGHGEAVIEPMTRLLKRSPELRPAALLLAAAYGSLDRFDDAAVITGEEEKWGPAETELQKTLQLDPNFGGAYDLLVQTYLVTNKLPQALSQLQTQLSKNPNDASALMTLALLHERTNEFAKARDAYEHLL